MFISVFVLALFTLYGTTTAAKHCYVPPPVPTAENNFPTFVKFYRKVYDQPNFVQVPLWPGGIVPYVWNVERNDDAYLRSAFVEAISQYESQTCIKFLPHDAKTVRPYMQVVSDSDNHAKVGMVGVVNNLSISCDDSFVYLRYKYLHDIGHVLGLSHEHQRYGRDAYVKVQYDNIQPGMEYTYIRTNLSTFFGPYDYSSLMHYPASAFAKSGQVVMVARNQRFQNRMGQTYGLSKCDVVRLNILYNCTGKPRDLNICRGDTSPDVCLDISDDCETWIDGQKDRTCEAYPGFYKLRYCPKSCGNCGKQCEDSKNTLLMATYCANVKLPCDNTTQRSVCPKTCGTCDEFM